VGSASSGTPRLYRVKPGDTLFSIARQFSTTVAQIKQMNGLSGDSIKVGEQLKLPR
jgi:LysM repeat protein